MDLSQAELDLANAAAFESHVGLTESLKLELSSTKEELEKAQREEQATDEREQ